MKETVLYKSDQTPFQKIKHALGNAGPLIALAALVILLSLLTDKFFTTVNILSIFKQATSAGLVAIGMMLAILTGGIDLSVGAIVGLSMVFMGEGVKAGLNPYICISLCIFGGAVLGLFNGLAYTMLRLPHPYIVTLGTLNIFRGICLLITGGSPFSGMPEEIRFLGQYSIGDIFPVCIILLVVSYIIFGFFLTRTTLGRRIYATGGNPLTAKLAGINIKFTLCSVYTLSGLMCGLSGLVLAGRVDSVFPNAGLTWETDAIAAVIIGGASFFGGKGTIWGTFSGCLLIAVLKNGMNIMGVTPDLQTVAIGTMIILAVFIDIVRNGGFKTVKSVYAKTQSKENK